MIIILIQSIDISIIKHLFTGCEWNSSLFDSRQKLFPSGKPSGGNSCLGLIKRAIPLTIIEYVYNICREVQFDVWSKNVHYFCLFGVSRPTREIFTHVETSVRIQRVKSRKLLNSNAFRWNTYILFSFWNNQGFYIQRF